MNQKEKELFKSLCSFKQQKFDENFHDGNGGNVRFLLRDRLDGGDWCRFGQQWPDHIHHLVGGLDILLQRFSLPGLHNAAN